MVGLGGAGLAGAQVTAQAQELAPGTGRGARVESRLHLRQPVFRFVDARRGQQRLSCDQFSFDRFSRRRVGGLGDLVGDGERFVGLPAARRQSRGDHAQRPLVPAAGVAAVGAISFGGAPQVLGGVLVVATHQRHLGQRVVDRASGLVELHRAANVERAVQHGVGAIEVADPDANLSKRRERNRESRSLAESFVKIDGAFREGQRLLIAVTDQRDVGLVAIDGRQHVIGLQQGRHALGLAQGGVGFFVATGLGQHDR